MSHYSQYYLPQSLVLRSYVECYRLVHFDQAIEGSTIANGRLDLTILLSGSMAVKRAEGYEDIPAFAVFPFTRSGINQLRIGAGSDIINVKLYPNVLSTKAFYGIDWSQFQSWASIFGSTPEIKELDGHNSDWVGSLDSFFISHMISSNEEEVILVNEAIRFIESETDAETTLTTFCEQNGISLKTLDRSFKKITSLTAKGYADLVKFQKAVKTIRGAGRYEHGDLLDALACGYYDQSHFAKVCKKLTGQSPKSFLSKLPLDLTDFVFSD